LDVVDLEFTGGAKHRTLRVFLEKDAAARAKFVQEAASAAASPDAQEAVLPSGVPVEMLSFVTHEDLAAFATDFGTVLDVEDSIPGAEYTLEVSSPGIERKLLKPLDYDRFNGSLAKVQTFTPIDNNRHFTGRLTASTDVAITLDISAVKQKAKSKKALTEQTVTILFANIEKANLVAEI
jgi:ribosome maturation factor RimP